ncbi:DUF1361 domain-containing protein [Paenibacillus puldeungensis]|uniref:DUF1361 domain-containing protein n=1 Tax=Paenibacillus puldeungensis TaxID=696536 RepID=A0ABW3S1Q0_9BACL
MKQRLKELGYPAKLYVCIVLFAGTVIGMKYAMEIKLPSGGHPYLFLLWNAFLAWIPLGLAIALDLISLLRQNVVKLLITIPVGLLWLFFYPNAAYIITDLLHPFARYKIVDNNRFWLENAFWDHLFTMFFAALIGLAIAMISLASVHRLVQRRWGSWAGWAFSILVLLLSSFGIYLGRFMRWNSWDLLHPRFVLNETIAYFMEPGQLMHAFAFCKWVFMITLFNYLVLYGFGVVMRMQTSSLSK